MKKPTLLYVEETKNILSQKVIASKKINLILLRFKQNMFFEERYIEKTSHIPCFIYDREKRVKDEIKRFKSFCKQHKIIIDYFFNDSEYNQEMIQEFATLLKLPGALNKEQALCVRDKAVMKDRLQEIGYRTMPYEEISSLGDVWKFSKKCGGFPVIVKWRRGLSSKEVYRVESEEHLKQLGLDYSTGRYIVEKYCPHLIWCIDSLIQDGKVVTTFYAWLPYTNLSFAVKKEKFAQITVSERPDEFKFDGTKIIQNIINEIGLKNGYMHLEAFVDPFGQPTICEFAWRTPGEHMLLNHSITFGIDVYSALIDIMIGKKVKLRTLIGKKCVGDMFLPLTDGIISKISTYNNLKKLGGVINGDVFYSIGDTVETKRQYTSCSGWIQVVGKTKDQVLERMLNVYNNFVIKTTA